MEKSAPHNIASQFNDFLKAGDDVASADCLTALIGGSVEPLVKGLIRGKLHVSLQIHDERQINQDAHDLVSEVKTLIIDKLNKLKTANGNGRIDNLEAYVSTVTVNVTNHYLRKKYPHRLRLKNQLRYLLTHDRRFSLWTSKAGDWHCGLVEWRENKADLAEIERSDGLRQELDKGGIFPDRSELVDLVAAVFDYFQRPLGFGGLVTILHELKRITEPIEVLEDETNYEKSPAYETDLLDRLEQKAFLTTLWDEIGRLPLRHRAALLLNLRNSQGDGLITLLPVTRVATIRQIADRLEFPVNEFARIWNDLPWDDLTIAEHLKLTRQQVINLRQSARATLRRRLNYF